MGHICEDRGDIAMRMEMCMGIGDEKCVQLETVIINIHNYYVDTFLSDVFLLVM